ncbi:FAD-dependent monooxygenase [Actinoplanes sp. NBRC 101535]|uniref:FAD-dependent monooxygenase n=1 Tax=Actinoplanes sp. NBRC 101535 TaxID=3032196 RepID=UPI0024A347A7|nr:FAD-dependent monooxygenase [Actinoplanes sp. NBRC 101535]GLY04209.1 FAD-dependent oxidoreductase [Actinoplanes sp. NBRC 101535]
MPAVESVLVVGAGAAGCATAILLASAGVTVDLIDSRPTVGAVGSGITLQGNALRVLRTLGVWEDLRPRGYAFDGLGIRAPGPQAALLGEVTDNRTGGPDLPATFGTYRPVLARILVERAAAAGARIRYGTALTGLDQDATAVTAHFADGTSGVYDLVVGADGLHSTTRSAVGIDLPTTDVGMDIWRFVAPRPPSVTRTELIFGGPLFIAGFCPTGDDSLYGFLVERPQNRGDLPPAEALELVRSLAEPYHGPWDDIVASSPVNFTRFQVHLLPPPWNRGRVVLIGDATHVCPPTVAQGAAQSLEDAAVLAELLTTRHTVDDDLWTAFTERRYERVKTVVDVSMQMCHWLLEGVRGDVPGLHARVFQAVSHPA